MLKPTSDFWKTFFPSPDHFGRLVGYRFVREDIAQKCVELELVIEEKHISPSGVVHGGVLSTLVDTSMGGAICILLNNEQICSTIELKINYLSPVRFGDTLRAVAHVIHLGRSHAIVEVDLLVGEKKVAKALGTFNIYRPRWMDAKPNEDEAT